MQILPYAHRKPPQDSSMKTLHPQIISEP
uniref:Uncharacterized protein n=1 Tax=Anguilla anguilla TaxID=7936 RepID=A0A0E9SGY8_ANGAN